MPSPTGPSGTASSATPDFQWLAVTGATGYDLTLEDVTSGTTVLDAVPVSATSYTPSRPLQNLDTYRWSVAAYAVLGGTTYSGPPSGTAYFTLNLDVPTPISPKSQDQLTTIPQFQWSPVAGAVSYTVTIVDERPDPQTQTTTSLSGTSYTPASFAYGEYQWSVQDSINQGDSVVLGPMSQPIDFYYNSNSPSVSYILQIFPPPPISRYVNTTEPYFLYLYENGLLSGPEYIGASVNIDLYDLDTNELVSAGTQFVFGGPGYPPVVQVPFAPTFPLDNGHTYKLSLSDDFGATASDTFTVEVPDGGAQTLAAPTPTPPGGVVDSNGATLQWSPVPGATGYEVFLNLGNGSQVTPYVVAGTSLALSAGSNGLAAGAVYSWKVSAYDGSGDFSPLSKEADFAVDAPGSSSLSAPTGLSPAATVSSYTPTLSWSAVPGATSYYVAVFDETSGTLLESSNVSPAAGIGPSYQIGSSDGAPPLMRGHVYRWYVLGQAQREDGPATSQEFTVSAPPIGSPGPISPAAGGVVNTTTPTFEWSAVPGAVDYLLTIDDMTSHPVLFDAVVGGTSYTPKGTLLLDDSDYQWYVVAAVMNGSTSVLGPPSAVSEFVVSVPGIPVVDSPAPGATLTTSTPTLEWSPVTGAAGYQLSLFDTTDGLPVLYDDPLTSRRRTASPPPECRRQL